MSFPSKFKGKCKDCKKEWAAGNTISKNSNGNWCFDGMGCSSSTQTNTTTTNSENLDKKVAETDFSSFIKHELRILKEIEEIVKDDLGDANPARIGMFVKELYCANKSRSKK